MKNIDYVFSIINLLIISLSVACLFSAVVFSIIGDGEKSYNLLILGCILNIMVNVNEIKLKTKKDHESNS